MTEIVRFGLLGVGAGSAYALSAIALVLMYRGSGVVHFASGAVGMVGAFVFYELRGNGLATPVALVVALGCGAGINAVFYAGIMRQLRDAPALTRVIATLGLLSVLLASGLAWWADNTTAVSKLLPTTEVVLWGDVAVQRDRLILLGIAIGLTALLAPVYRWTTFGRATTAVAENRRAAGCAGVSEDVVATSNWALGGALAVLGAVLIVNVSGLSIQNLTFLVIPASAAAVVGGFNSFLAALAGGLAIGVLESELTYVQTSHPDLPLEGLAAAVPFIVILTVLVTRGRPLPVRGELSQRPPEIGSGRISPTAVAAFAVVTCGIILITSNSVAAAVSMSSALSVICMSVIVLTGYTGQISLAQIGLAGLGGWFGAKVVVATGSFELGFLVGVLALVPIGLIVGLPAVRVRGINLAIVTLAMSLFINAQFLDNARLTGGFTGLEIGRARFFGIDVDPVSHPDRYAFLSIVVLALAAVLVANLRRGRVGRRLIAVRTNERAAAALGISVVHAKLYAFATAAGLAAVGGLLITFRAPVVSFQPTFSVFESILVLLGTVIGGVGYMGGAMIGGLVDPSGLVPYVVRNLIGSSHTIAIVLGALLLIQLIVMPNGVVHENLLLLRRLWRRRPASRDQLPASVPRIAQRVEPKVLELSGVSVSFGGVRAVMDVSFMVEPGTVVGLIGPNGAGKTTVIDAATGFVSCSAGEVRLNGRDVTSNPARQRARAGLGRSFQSLELFDTMTVYANLLTACDRRDALAYATDLVRPGRAELTGVALAAVAEFSLTSVLDERTGSLPFGTRRLVAIARAIAANPSVLLLDEPAAGLDEAEVAELRRLIRRLADEWNMAILLVEHNVSLVMDVSDRVVVLDGGRAIAAGCPEEVQANDAVARAYLGEAEVLPTTRCSVRQSADDHLTAASALLEARGVVAGYGDVPAIRGVDIAVTPGEVVALLGPNGAGKSTTLAALAGALRSMEGEVRWEGSATRKPLHRRTREGLAFVPEERAIVPGLTVDANLRLWRGDREIAYELFPRLQSIQQRVAGRLSGGEQQMLALGCALSRRPSVLLIDELSLGLAPLVVRDLLATIRTAADDGLGVLLVEQHIHMALEIADRVCVLDRGRVALSTNARDAAQRMDEIEDLYMGHARVAVTG